jgi:hypothetical protein
MDHERQDAYLVHEHDIFGETSTQSVVGHSTSAVFDDNDLALPALDVRQYLY